jgi:uncharacterized surface protein with fasciclin (FAS1) repeats
MVKKTTLNFIKSKSNLVLFLCFTLLSVAGCKDGFDEYWQYNKAAEGFLISKLQADPQFSTFVQGLERSGLSKTLDKAGVYTVFAPNNDAFQAYFSRIGKTIETIDQEELTTLLNYHIVYYTYYEYDFQKRFKTSPNANSSTYYLNRASKYLKVTTVDPATKQPVFKVNDVKVLSTTNGAEVKEVKDLQAENGVIHGITGVLEVPSNIVQILASKPEFSTFYKLIRVLRDSINDPRNTFDKNSDGVIDSSFYTIHNYLSNNITVGNPVFPDVEFRPTTSGSGLGSQQLITVLVPTNAALDPIINPILPVFSNRYDSLPVEYVGLLLQHHFLENGRNYSSQEVWNPTKPLDVLSGFDLAVSATGDLRPSDKAANLSDIEASNGTIHGITRTLQSSRIMSATGKALLDPELKIFVQALIKAGLFNNSNDYMRWTQSNTILAPTNEAFTKMGFNIQKMTFNGTTITSSALRAVLQYHIINSTQRKATLNGIKGTVFNRFGTSAEIEINTTTNEVKGETNAGSIVFYDLSGAPNANGTPSGTVIHKINTVLIPDFSK